MIIHDPPGTGMRAHAALRYVAPRAMRGPEPHGARARMPSWRAYAASLAHPLRLMRLRTSARRRSQSAVDTLVADARRGFDMHPERSLTA